MSFVYEVNGQRIEFEKEPTEKDIDEAARATKPPPKSARPQPVEGTGGAAFGVYPQAGRRPESQQDRVASQDMALQTARGVASNVPAVLGIPGTVINTVANLPRTAQDIQNRYQRVVTGSDAPLPELPPYNQVTPYDMNYFGQLTPGPEPTSPAGQLAFAGGQVAGAPIMTRTIQGVAQAPGQVMNTARELRTGVTEGLRNPTYQSNATTAFQPLKETYYPTPEVQRFQAMPAAQRPAALPALEASQQPSASLFQTPGQMLARNLGPSAAGQTLIPLQGRTTRALGEQVARDVSNRPFTAGGVGLGGAAMGGLLGGPIGAMAGLALAPGMRFAQLAAMNKLSQTAGFAPGFTEQLAAARGRAGIQSGMPTTPALGYTPPGGAASAAGPVNPATMYAGAGGVSADLGTAGAAALNVKYPSFTPPQAVPQAAAERVTTSPSQSLAATPRGQEILAQLQQRAQASGAKYTPPRVDTPTVAPVAPTELPAAPAPAASTLDQLRSRLTPQTPEQAAAVDAYNALSPAEKARQTRAETATRKMETDLQNELKIMGNNKPVVSADRKTLTYTDKENFESEPSSLPGELPKGFTGKNEPDWKRQNLHYDENENVLGTSWESDGSKNKPAYKFETIFSSDEPGKLYKKEPGGNWEEVQTTSSQTPVKKAPPGITNMMTEEQLKVFNALKRSDSTANLLRQLKESGDPNAKSLAELLEKQGYNNKNK